MSTFECKKDCYWAMHDEPSCEARAKALLEVTTRPDVDLSYTEDTCPNLVLCEILDVNDPVYEEAMNLAERIETREPLTQPVLPPEQAAFFDEILRAISPSYREKSNA